MSAVGLPARICYAIVALPAGGAAGFYSVIWLLPKLADLLQQPDLGLENYTMFASALFFGGAVALTASLVALTLPWKRRRKHRGRELRIVLSSIFVVLASAAFSGLGNALIVDLAFAGWLAYTVTFTIVRYGVLDHARRPSNPARTSSPASGKD
jgi:hypothetical protein